MLSVSDAFSKFTRLYPTKSTKAEFIECFKEETPRFGNLTTPQTGNHY